MTVDLNECRIELVHQFNRLTVKLNNARDGENINIPISDIEKCYNSMRTCIIFIVHSYMKDNPDYAHISNEIPDIEHFNEIDE